MAAVASVPALAAAQDTGNAIDEEALHQQLRDMSAALEGALDARDKDAILAEFAPELHFTSINNEHISGMDEAGAYFDQMLAGENSFIQEMRVTLEPEALSTIYLEGPVAISAGSSDAYFKTTSGVDMSAPLRWTATMVREDGGWKVAAAHFSANIFDNPLSSKLTRYATVIGVIIAVVFLTLGFFLGRRGRG
jgi:ketosteroid isomerase-like protein